MSLIGFSLSSGITLLILAAVFVLMVRNTTHFTLNRFCLIGILIISILIPFITLPDLAEKTSGAVEWGEVIAIPGENRARLSPRSGKLLHILGIIYTVGVSLMAARALANIVFILYLRHTGRVVAIGKYTVRVHTHKGICPMSWGGEIFMEEQLLDCNAAELDMILQYENAHRRCYHWIDLLLSNIVLAVNWYNPAAWFIQHELIDMHEFEADFIASEHTKNPIDYQLLLIKRTAGSRFHAITDSLNHSSLKKRITMMMKNRSKNSARLRSLALLPAIAVALVLTNSSCVKDAQKEVSQAESAEEIQISEAPANSASETAHTDTVKGKLMVYDETDSSTHVVRMTILKEAGDEVVELIHAVALQTNYPQEAIDKEIQGRVLVEVTVDAKGKITDAKIKQGVHELLDKEAMKAIDKVRASGTKFKLTTSEGQPIASTLVVPVDFRLK